MIRTRNSEKVNQAAIIKLSPGRFAFCEFKGAFSEVQHCAERKVSASETNSNRNREPLSRSGLCVFSKFFNQRYRNIYRRLSSCDHHEIIAAKEERNEWYGATRRLEVLTHSVAGRPMYRIIHASCERSQRRNGFVPLHLASDAVAVGVEQS